MAVRRIWPRARSTLVVGVTGVMILAAAGCGLEPGSDLCTEPQLELVDVTTTEATEPLTLAGRLTVAGTPLVGGEVSYFVVRQDPDGDVLGVRVGSAHTDADGWARLTFAGGSRDLPAFKDQEVVGYTARFVSLTKIDGVQYCRTQAEADLTVSCAGFSCRQ